MITGIQEAAAAAVREYVASNGLCSAIWDGVFFDYAFGRFAAIHERGDVWSIRRVCADGFGRILFEYECAVHVNRH